MRLLTLIIGTFLFLNGSSQTRFFAFVDSLVVTSQVRQSHLLQEKVNTAILSAGIKVTPAAKAKLETLAAYHALLTSNGAYNGNTYGALQIPYFWNYGAVNPRDSIYLVAKNKPLRALSPPAGFGKYQSYASVDRTPFLFWADVANEKPVYSHEGQKFYSFGWCSEREMAFRAWLNLKSIPSTICFAGIHVWNEVELPELPGYLVKIDNTFNGFSIVPLAQKTKANSNDKYLQWYNSMGASSTAKNQLAELRITPVRAKEIERTVTGFFK